MTAARAALAAVALTAAGIALLSRLDRRPRSGPGLAGLGFFLGTLAAAFWTHLLLWIRIPVNLYTVSAGIIALAAIGRWSVLKEAVWKRPPWPAWLLLPAAILLLAGAASWPLIGFDPEAFYAMKAKSIVHYGTFWNEDFLDPARIHPAHRRPLLLPSIYADLYLLSGSRDGTLLRIWFSLFQIAAWPAIYDALRSRADRLSAAGGAAFLAFLPVLWRDSGGALTGYADAPLSLIFLFALTWGGPLAVFLLAAGALLKDEGTAFLLAWALLRGPRVVLLPAAVAVAWMVTASFLPADWDYLPHKFLNPHLSNLPLIARRVGGEFVGVKQWSILWIAFLGVVAWQAKRLTREDARWLGPLGLQLAAYAGVWCTMDPEILPRLIKAEETRLLMHLAPSAWAWTVWKSTAAA